MTLRGWLATVFAILVALNFADWAITVQGLEGGAVELNPIMAAAFERGTGWALALKAGVLAAAGTLIIYKPRAWTVAPLAVITAGYVLVVAWNITQLA